MIDELQDITAAKRGDDAALARLLQHHYLFVFKYLLKVTLERSAAEDLTQETMIRAIRKIQLYDASKSGFSSWLMTIATHLYLDEKRRRKREEELISGGELSRALHWQLESSSYEWSALIDALSQLSHEVRTAVVLRHFYGYTYKEIALILNIRVGTAKSRVHNGLRAVRKEWMADEERTQSQE